MPKDSRNQYGYLTEEDPVRNPSGYCPQETFYNGKIYKSRAEVKWAIIFNYLNIKYEYEPKLFNLGNIKYLPDFYLPNQNYWIEIKSNQDGIDGENKILELSRYINDPIYVFNGYPRTGLFQNIIDSSYNYEICGFRIYQYLNGLIEIGKNTNLCLLKILGFNPVTLQKFKYYTDLIYKAACLEFYNPYTTKIFCHKVVDVTMKNYIN